MNMKSMLKKFAVTILAMLYMVNQVYAGNAMHIVINDHLGTPQMLIDENRNVVWQAEYDEFGKANILVQQVEFNQRFPGQYYDKETGLHYNYYRDYDPSTGRYVESDPIGLGGGINTYAYVSGNPLMYVDPSGLSSTTWGGDEGTTAAGVAGICILMPEVCVVGAGAVGLACYLDPGCSSAVNKIIDACTGGGDDDNECKATDSREQAFTKASEYAGMNSDWCSIPWSDYNKPKNKADQIKYTTLRQNAGSDPYGHQCPNTGGEVVEHAADTDHKCAHFHAKKSLADSGQVFEYK